MTRKNSAQKATTHSARANQTRPNRPTSPLSPKSRQRKPLTAAQRERKNAHDRARRAAQKGHPTARSSACTDCQSCRRLAQCRASGRTDGYPKALPAAVSRPPVLPPQEGRPAAAASAPVPQRLGNPRTILVPLTTGPCRLGVAQPVYAASGAARRPAYSSFVAALKTLLDLVDPTVQSAPRACGLPVRPFRRDVCDLVERRNAACPEEGWE